LELNNTNNYRPVESWYSHYQVRDGYTNRGQLLGSGIGPGSNMQSLELSWLNKLKVFGVQIDRTVQNNDFHYFAIKNIDKHWVDIGLTAFTQWSYKSLLLNAKLKGINSINYQYSNADGNVLNLHFQLGVIYSLSKVF